MSTTQRPSAGSGPNRCIRAGISEKDVLLIPHAHNSGDWRVMDPDLVRLVEFMSQHGTFEWSGRMYMQQGHQVGEIAASDNHLSQPGCSSPPGAGMSQRAGLATVYSSDKTTDGIFNALRSLRTYATNGERIILDFNVNGVPMGTGATMDKVRRISGQVIGTAPLESVTVLKTLDVCRALHVPDPRPARDALIAVTALSHGMSVVTRNPADFRYPGLAVLDPWLLRKH